MLALLLSRAGQVACAGAIWWKETEVAAADLDFGRLDC